MKVAAPYLIPGRLGLCILFISATSLLPRDLIAQEPKRPSEPAVLQESAVDLLQIPDAFDETDPFDLNLSLSFRHESKRAMVYRQSGTSSPTNTATSSKGLPVGRSVITTERLIPEVQLGLLPDLALKIRLPVILAHNRRLDDREGSNATTPAALSGLGGNQLFQVPFESPTRSGIEYLALGIDYGLMNQFRTDALLNWVIGFEGRLNVSRPMNACNDEPAEGQVRCANASDINRNGEVDNLNSSFGSIAGQAEGSPSDEPTKPGVSRGTNGLEVHSYFSQRFDSLEPYAGVSALFEFPIMNSAYAAKGLDERQSNRPPIRSTLKAGIAFIPWEQVEKFQRVYFDFRVSGTLISRGREYTELFDALGSSDAPSLRNPNFDEYAENTSADGTVDVEQPSVVQANSQRVYFTGLSEISPHGEFELRSSFSWRAGSYVRFDLGGAAQIIQGHLITASESCTEPSTDDVTNAGPCKVKKNEPAETLDDWEVTGAPNSNYRASINAPGQRYQVATSFGFSAWLHASVLF